MGHLANAGVLIVQAVFGLLAGLFFFRFLMQGLRVDFRNPLSQFVYKLTNPVLIPIQKALPVVRGWNLAALLVTFLLVVRLVVVTSGGEPLGPGGGALDERPHRRVDAAA